MGDHVVQIRFNTERERKDGSLPAWRLLIDGVEHLAESVEIQVPCRTTQDLLPSGIVKWHVSCRGMVRWLGGGRAVIEAHE